MHVESARILLLVVNYELNNKPENFTKLEGQSSLASELANSIMSSDLLRICDPRAYYNQFILEGIYPDGRRIQDFRPVTIQVRFHTFFLYLNYLFWCWIYIFPYLFYNRLVLIVYRKSVT